MNILIVDDEKNIRRSLEMILSGEGHSVKTAKDSAEAWQTVKQETFDLIFLDVLLPGEDGLVALKKMKQSDPEMEVVMISGHGTLSMAVEATRAGAYDFLEKPLQKEKILLTIRHVSESRNLRDEYQKWRRERLDEYRMIGESEAIRRIQEQIGKVATTDSKVLVLGESGVGKELVAWAIHHRSARRERPFVKMNCAAIPEELTESELFGYEKGAFTGAAQTRDGKFRQADGGTLFLDEIADMSLRVQTKVLRVLQDGQFERVGGKSTLTVNVRVIAATNKKLEEMITEGTFREDLYYRLNVFPITVPPLRERPEDIPLLLAHFIKKYCLENNRRPVEVAEDVLKVLKNYPWPGNIRELKNLVERVLIMNPGSRIGVSELPPHVQKPDQAFRAAVPGTRSLKEVRQMAERDYIIRCLDSCQGNVTEAARLLGLERTNLHKKMKVLGITREE